MLKSTEIYLTKKKVTQEDWLNLIQAISNYQKKLSTWKLSILFHQNEIRYYITSSTPLPPTIHNLPTFLIKETSIKNFPPLKYSGIYIHPLTESHLELYQQLTVKKNKILVGIELKFYKLSKNKYISTETLYIKEKKLKKYKQLITAAPLLLNIDFENNNSFRYKGAPKYLDINKALSVLKNTMENSLFQLDTFPYLQGKFYLAHASYDFDKHSVILGSSGSGKSKFISLLIHNIKKDITSQQKHKVIVIDPHASLERDIGGLGTTIDFKTTEASIDLFMNQKKDVISSTELLLELLKSLLQDQYNSKVERVLRHSIYLLLLAENFSFQSLRKLILDAEYRISILKKLDAILPTSIVDFFLSDFNELKTQSHTTAISPIIAFIDEMDLLPAFDTQNIKNNLTSTIEDNFLTIFSLDRTKLGDKITKTISGLIMQQLLTLIEQYTFKEHLILIIDEVSLIDNPMLARFLSEARKYNLSLIIAGQYFNQITEKTKDAIFANVINYYIFRVSKLDATQLVDNFNMTIPLDNTKERKIKLLTELNNRDCIIRISANGNLLPAMKGTTLNFESIPRIIKKQKPKEPTPITTQNKKNFSTKLTTNVKDLLLATSSSRKVVK